MALMPMLEGRAAMVGGVFWGGNEEETERYCAGKRGAFTPLV